VNDQVIMLLPYASACFEWQLVNDRLIMLLPCATACLRAAQSFFLSFKLLVLFLFRVLTLLAMSSNDTRDSYVCERLCSFFCFLECRLHTQNMGNMQRTAYEYYKTNESPTLESFVTTPCDILNMFPYNNNDVTRRGQAALLLQRQREFKTRAQGFLPVGLLAFGTDLLSFIEAHTLFTNKCWFETMLIEFFDGMAMHQVL
jgi:hypothetical protein